MRRIVIAVLLIGFLTLGVSAFSGFYAGMRRGSQEAREALQNMGTRLLGPVDDCVGKLSMYIMLGDMSRDQAIAHVDENCADAKSRVANEPLEQEWMRERLYQAIAALGERAKKTLGKIEPNGHYGYSTPELDSLAIKVAVGIGEMHHYQAIAVLSRFGMGQGDDQSWDALFERIRGGDDAPNS